MNLLLSVFFTRNIMKSSANLISCIDPLSFPFKTPDPFLFCVYHKDFYPAGFFWIQRFQLLSRYCAGDNLMQAPRKGNGADFNPTAPYRMYHGDRIPGFPQHPHRRVLVDMSHLIDVISEALRPSLRRLQA